MSPTGGILPIIKVGIDYGQQKENITNFLRYAKGVVPALSMNADRTTDVLGAVSSMDVDDEEEETESVMDDLHSMDLDESHPRTRRRRREADTLKYMEQLQKITNREQKALIVDLKDLQEFLNAQMRGSGTDLAIGIEGNASHYVELISECVDSILAEMTPTVDISHKDDVLDVIIHQRQERNARQSQGRSLGPDAMQSQMDGEEQEDASQAALPFPPSLLRRYTVYLKPLSATGKDSKPMAVRSIRAEHIGSLVTLRGIVTRVSEVKPYLQVDAYACDQCGAEIFQEIKGRQYMPLTECPAECKRNNVKGSLFQQVRASKFVPFQEIKMQEMTDQVPVGHIPRMMTIHMSGPLTRSLNPGDVCDVSGIFLPTPYTGFKAIRAGLLTDTFLQAQHVRQLRKSYSALEGELTAETSERIRSLSREGDVYDKLAASIAPEIYGHEDVKKCLLLLLVGGVTCDMPDGMHIRGDINVCLMGDPGVAKSQLLKYISKIAPRGVYTTGRGSSGVGLTAAVMRDPVTEEMVLEGGALVLADNGIACIDEFDKMEESDRTAIHEVMEQQTISISKAGISTTLNARTSILAAANPLYGRYNPRISPVDNINLPAALLSRFDILFLILDTPSREDDERLAQHVAYVHMHSEHPPLTFQPLEPQLMKHYIARARQYQPNVTKAVSEYLVSAYVKLRNQTKDDEERGQAYTYTSARTLLGIVRMSQALARLRFSEQVEIGDVDEALRLLDVSKSSLTVTSRRDNIQDGTTNDYSSVTKIYRIIRDMAMAIGHEGRDAIRESRLRGKRAELPQGVQEDEDWLQDENAPGPLNMRDVRERIIAAGWVEDQLQECLREYEDLGVIQVANGNRLVFL
ncbi:putative DNA replication licensing factor [Meira miltonrushii]|uniref:DNA replication licensing factor MCM7 n=1 Tax=Meira miltonrushii TaxID=1280837 RepID=A0A316VIY9_9BASI|nr:putative DNA replication licensing factor [Meira miltonrushii]PWN36263.1 putative DNA replication licensing factor [Meira miltonrushii]